MLQRFGKPLTSVFFAALIVAYAALGGDQHIDPTEWVAVAIAFTGAVGVYLVPLVPKYRWSKTAVGVLLAVLQVLATLILGGLDSNEWILLLLTAGQALGVIVAPSVSDNGIGSKSPAGTSEAA